MSGNRTGGIKAASKNKQNNPDFYREIGSLGGRARVPKGFAVRRDLAREAGAKGGRISRRNAAVKLKDAETNTDTFSGLESILRPFRGQND